MNEEWLPFKLVAFPESMGDPRYSLMFTDFKELEPLIASYDVENDGYTWQELIQIGVQSMYPGEAGTLQFDSESSMLCVSGSDLPTLGNIKRVLARLITDRIFLSNSLSRLDEFRS